MRINQQKRKTPKWVWIAGSILLAILIAFLVFVLTAGMGNPTMSTDILKNIATGTGEYQFYTNSNAFGLSAGPAFTAENCFDEQKGEYFTVELAYALYVPEDYNPNGRYALVTVDNPATNAGAHPFESVITSRSPTYFASAQAQQIIKDTHGLDGLIVVVPTITQRVGDNSASPAGFPAIVKLWDHLQEEYSIDKNHIYGVGQSVGGMMLLETNTKRDNYFAGILMYDNQWGQNYYKDEVFARDMSINYAKESPENTPRHYPATDSIAWDYHWGNDGEKVYENHDPNNYYYMVSDDNIMITNSANNHLSNGVWQEQSFLYQDLAGYKIPRLMHLNPKDNKKAQEQAIKDYLAEPNIYNENDMGLYWITFEGGASMTTPVWSRRLDAPYEWLLTQTREAEMARPKLDLNKPFEGALIASAERAVQGFTAPDGNEDVYYWTGKAGSGTQFYNTSWLNLGQVADNVPGWLPGDMEHPVEPATIQEVTAITDGTSLTAVAVKYSTDMENAVIHMKGDNVLDSKGNPRDNDFVVMDTFDLYDESGNKIDGVITNIYISDSPDTVPNAKRGSGAGYYVIIEVDTAWNGESIGVVQRATVRTDKAIAAANSKVWR